MNVLIGVDDSAYSDAAVRYVIRAAWPKGTRFFVLSAVAPVFAGPGEAVSGDAIARLLRAQEKYHKEIAQRAASRLRKAGLTAEGFVAVGDPRAMLMEWARSRKADLLAVGSHGRTGFRKLMLGSVASHVVAHAPCSVLVVRRKGGRVR
jgi:nucleotide-binding universal stress UspA family protein